MESGTIEEDVKPTEQEIKQRRKIDDNDEMVRATMNTYGVTSANHTYPILKTVGLSFCVGVALYDPDSKVAGLIHIIEPDRSRGYSAMVSIKNDIKNMLTTMEKHGVTIEARKKIQAHIIGGLRGDDTPKQVRERLHILGINNILTDERVDDVSLQVSQNIAVDARTGEVFNLVNIKPGKIDKLDEMRGLSRTMLGAYLTRDRKTLS